MSKLNSVPVIDLFAGPGGLGEGFSSVKNGTKRSFELKLSIEKDLNAHKTLELRSFYRQFSHSKLPDSYYKVLRETDINKRELLMSDLYNSYKSQYKEALNEAWRAELGSPQFSTELIDQRITEKLGNEKDWVLIGGPPCQAYSLAGRSRVGGINNSDHRVYLYKEYLRVIAIHHPSVFVMENVKGLLSAKVNGEKVFHWMLRDLRDPSSVFSKYDSPKYKIFSFATGIKGMDLYGNPVYKDDSDFLIQSEQYGVPQKRHRIILLGIREDIDIIPNILSKNENGVTVKQVIGDLPRIRSGLNRSFLTSDFSIGKKKRIYQSENDTDKNWKTIVNGFRQEIISWNGFAKDYSSSEINAPQKGTGSEFIKYKFSPSIKNPLYDWYNDDRLGGVCNHKSRSHLTQDLKRYMFSSMFTKRYNRFPRLHEFNKHSNELLPDHENAKTGKFVDRFRVQLPHEPATTITSHISKDGHYFIHYDPNQCRSLTVREAARIQTFPDNYLFCGTRTAQFHQVGNAVPPYLAYQIAKIVLEIFKKMKTNENPQERSANL